jgi:hypothetical protein
MRDVWKPLEMKLGSIPVKADKAASFKLGGNIRGWLVQTKSAKGMVVKTATGSTIDA